MPETTKLETPPPGNDVKSADSPGVNWPNDIPSTETVNGASNPGGKSTICVKSEPPVIRYSKPDATNGSDHTPVGTSSKRQVNPAQSMGSHGLLKDPSRFSN